VRRVLFSVVATLLGLALIEGVSAVVLGVVEGDEDVAGGWSARSEDWVVNAKGAFEEGFFTPDRQSLWRANPGYVVPSTPEGFWGDAELRLNEHGHRNPPTTKAKAAGSKRILVLGGSHPFGMWVSTAESYSAVLEASLPGWEVLNAACPGHTTFQGRQYLEHRGLAFEPDIVIFDLGVNDELPLSPDFAQPDHVVQAVPWWITQAVSLADLSSTYLLLKRALAGRVEPQGDVRVPPQNRRTNVAAARALSEAAGAKFLLVSQLYAEKSGVVCTEDYSGQGEVLDLCPVFAVHGADVGRFFHDPIHANAPGHAVIAEALGTKLRALGWAP
jgi:lysophospholipase L1-like esterase